MSGYQRTFCGLTSRLAGEVRQAPATVEESHMLSAAARAYAGTDSVTGIFITADVYELPEDKFTLEADVSDVLDHHGPGIYTVQVWATLDGEPAVISAVSVFHEVQVPEGYGPR